MLEQFKRQSLETQGIIFMILSQFFFAANDGFVKYILLIHDNDISFLGQIVFIRGIFATIFIGLILFAKKQLELKRMLTSKHLLTRGLIEAVCGIFFFLGLASLPFADLYVLLNLAPILITASGAILLKEIVGWRRWSAVILGFMGVLVVVNPGELEFGYAFAFPLIAAILITYRDTYTRSFQDKFDSIQIAFVTCFVVCVCYGIYMLFHLKSILLNELILILISAILLSCAYIFSVATVKIASISSTSTFRYTVIIWGLLFGYLFFQEVPSYHMIAGASIVVASGLFIIYRQKQIGIIN